MYYLRPYDLTTKLEFLASRIEIEIVLLFTYQLMKSDGPRKDGLSVEWRRLHNEEIYDLLFTQNIIRVMKSGRLIWAGHVALWETREMHTGWWLGNLRKTDSLGDKSISRITILKILKRRDGKSCFGFIRPSRLL